MRFAAASSNQRIIYSLFCLFVSPRLRMLCLFDIPLLLCEYVIFPSQKESFKCRQVKPLERKLVDEDVLILFKKKIEDCG